MTITLLHLEGCGIIVEMKLIALMIMLYRVNHLNVKQKKVRRTPVQPTQPGNDENADQPARPRVSTLSIDVTIPLRYLSNVWRSLDLAFINCKIVLDLSCSKKCILVEHHNNITGIVSPK